MRIVEFPHQWLSRSEMAIILGVSERTVTRRVSMGEVVRRETPNGNVYALARHEAGQDVSRESPAPTLVRDTARHTRQDKKSDLLEAILLRLEKLESEHTTLKSTHADLKTSHAELLIRLEAIEHATGWHVAVDGILEKRRKKLARIKR